MTRRNLTLAAGLPTHLLAVAQRLGAGSVALLLYRRYEDARLAGMVRLLRAGRRVELGGNDGQLVIEGVESPWSELDG